MAHGRCKDMRWVVPTKIGQSGEPIPADIHGQVLALMMDLRDELKRANDLNDRIVGVLECRNTMAIPGILRKIDKRLAQKIPLR